MRAAEGVFMAMLLKMNVGDVTVALIHAYLQVCSADLVHEYAVPENNSHGNLVRLAHHVLCMHGREVYGTSA